MWKIKEVADQAAMASRSLLSAYGPAIFKQQAIKDAELQQKITEEKLAKAGRPPTGYRLTELIGKGAYGRVYKR